MLLMLDGMYSVDVFLEGGDWTTRLRTIFRMFWQDVLICAFFYHYYLLVYVLRYVVYNFSIFLMFWYVIILSGGFLKVW